MKTILIFVNLETTIYNFRREVVTAFLQEGYRVILGLPKGERWQHFLDMGCELIEIPVDRRGVNPIKDILLLCQYCKILHTVRPDIVLTYTIKPNVYGGIACALTKTPYIASVTGLGDSIERKGILSWLTLFLYRLGLAKAQTVFFQNKANCNFFKSKNIVSDNYLLTSGSGVNLNHHMFYAYPEDDGTLLILWIARILKDKGIEEFLQSAKILKQKYLSVQFQMLGRNDSPQYGQKIEELQRQGVLLYHGQQSNVDQYIKKSHAVIVPSYHEGLCNALLEGASCGRPILTTNVAGCKETFDEGITGFGCPAKDVQGLTSIIEKFILLPYAEKRAMGLAGRHKVEKEFDRTLVVQTYLAEIKRILKG